jgi:hypothetical protein
VIRMEWGAISVTALTCGQDNMRRSHSN